MRIDDNLSGADLEAMRQRVEPEPGIGEQIMWCCVLAVVFFGLPLLAIFFHGSLQ